MPTLIETTPATFVRDPTITVRIAAKWNHLSATSPDYVDPIAYLYCDRLALRAAPEIDEAILRYDYGSILREDATEWEAVSPLADKTGQYVRIDVNAVDADGDPDTAKSFYWYGVVEVMQDSVLGNIGNVVAGSSDNVTAGTQQIVCYGLARMLERTIVRSSFVEPDAIGGFPLEMPRGLPFNLDEGNEMYTLRGNRSENEVGQSFAFSLTPRRNAKWSAMQAMKYLLHRHHPPGGPWLMAFTSGVAEAADWYDVSVRTDRRTLKAIMDELFDRRRAVSYYVYFDEGLGAVVVHVFTFSSEDILLPNGGVLPANPRQYSLDFETAYDVGDVSVTSLSHQRYTSIVVEGAFRTMTATFELAEADVISPETGSKLIPNWTDEQEANYQAGVSGEAGYDDLSFDVQYTRNTSFRMSTKYREVYRQWRLPEQWPQDVFSTLDPTYSWWIAPNGYPDVGSTIVDFGNSILTLGPEPFFHRVGIFLEALPMFESFDYSEDNIFTGSTTLDVEHPEAALGMSAFAFVTVDPDEDETQRTVVRLDRLADLAGTDGEFDFPFSVSLRFSDRNPIAILTVDGAAQQLLDGGDNSWETAASTDCAADPTCSRAIDWRTIQFTAAVQLDSRVSITIEGDTTVEGQSRELVLEMPDARCDMILPETVVDVRGGLPIRTTCGGYLRDDRPRMEAMANCAKKWYGVVRQTLDMDVRRFANIVSIGDLIISFGVRQVTDINTVVTEVVYTFGPSEMSTRFTTSYAELDPS